MSTQKQTRQQRVYVAGPYSGGDTGQNVHNAIVAANKLRARGFAPYVPHLNHMWHLVAPRTYEDWLDLDFQFLPCCDILLRLPGESPGADKEVELARSLSMLVFHDIPSLISACSPTTWTDEDARMAERREQWGTFTRHFEPSQDTKA